MSYITGFGLNSIRRWVQVASPFVKGEIQRKDIFNYLLSESENREFVDIYCPRSVSNNSPTKSDDGALLWLVLALLWKERYIKFDDKKSSVRNLVWMISIWKAKFSFYGEPKLTLG